MKNECDIEGGRGSCNKRFVFSFDFLGNPQPGEKEGFESQLK